MRASGHPAWMAEVLSLPFIGQELAPWRCRPVAVASSGLFPQPLWINVRASANLKRVGQHGLACQAGGIGEASALKPIEHLGSWAAKTEPRRALESATGLAFVALAVKD